MKPIIFTAWEGNYKTLKKLALSNITDWCQAASPVPIHFWLGPNMCKPCNINPLTKYIKDKKLYGILIPKDFEKELINNTSIELTYKPGTDNKLKSAYEKARFSILGPYCNYGAYTDFQRCIVPYYYLENKLFEKVVYFDAPDTFIKVPKNCCKLKSTELSELKSTELSELLGSQPKSGVEIGRSPDGTTFLNPFFSISNKSFAKYLQEEIMSKFYPCLFGYLAHFEDPMELLLNAYTGYFLEFKSDAKGKWNLRNVFGHTIHNSGPNFLHKIVLKYRKEHKFEKNDFNFVNEKFDKFIHFTLNWVEGERPYTNGGRRAFYGTLPKKEYLSNDEFINDLVESTIILVKNTNVLPIYYYITLIPMQMKLPSLRNYYYTPLTRRFEQYRQQQKIELDSSRDELNKYVNSYIEKLTVKLKQCNLLKEIKMVDIGWIKYARDHLLNNVLHKNVNNSDKRSPKLTLKLRDLDFVKSIIDNNKKLNNLLTSVNQAPLKFDPLKEEKFKPIATPSERGVSTNSRCAHAFI